jgi:hypothetical protein
MSDEFSILIKRFDPTDPRLGRHVVHDSRSLRYLAPARDLGTLVSIRHKVEIPIMDQGEVGSCTGPRRHRGDRFRGVLVRRPRRHRAGRPACVRRAPVLRRHQDRPVDGRVAAR